MVPHTYNLSAQEKEGKLQVQGYSELHNEILSQNTKKKGKKYMKGPGRQQSDDLKVLRGKYFNYNSI